MEEQLHKLSESVVIIGAKEQQGLDAATLFATTLKDATSAIKSGFEAWETNLRRACDLAAAEMNQSWTKQVVSVSPHLIDNTVVFTHYQSCLFPQAEKALKTVYGVVDAIVRDAQEYVATERIFLTALHASTEAASTAEVSF